MNTFAKPDNPWKRIGNQPPFVLEEDGPYIDAFNSTLSHNDKRRINLNHTPGPRLGPVTAPVVLLMNNPSYDPNKPSGHQDEQLTLWELESARDENYPHFVEVEPDKPKPWWKPRLKELINESGIGLEKLSRNICSIDYFPYRAREFGHDRKIIKLPSQNYTFALVRERLASGAIIIVTRGYGRWVSEIPELAGQMNRTVFCTNSHQCSYITRRNLPVGVFDKICDRLSSI
jgi:hypothetical protein